jgi:hypothetical protein
MKFEAGPARICLTSLAQNPLAKNKDIIPPIEVPQRYLNNYRQRLFLIVSKRSSIINTRIPLTPPPSILKIF